MRFFQLTSAVVLCVAQAASVQASVLKYHGVSYNDTLTLQGQTLHLNGAGHRGVAGWVGYTAGLYLTQPAKTAEAAQQAPGPKRMDLRMVFDFIHQVSPQEFTKAVVKGFDRQQSPTARQALDARMKQFNQTVDALGPLRKGDVIWLDYLPGQGTVLTVNGKVRGSTIPGTDFYNALMLCFIGDQVRDKKLLGMLGLKKS